MSDPDTLELDMLIARIVVHIINPLIFLLFALALILFLWGATKFLMGMEDETRREEGKSHMVWGIVGMSIMAAAFTIVRIIGNTLGDLYY